MPLKMVRLLQVNVCVSVPYICNTPVRWDRQTMSQSVHRTSLAVTGYRKRQKEIAKDCDNVARMSRDVARMSKCRGVSRKIVRVHEASRQSRRLRTTLRHYNRIPPDWGVIVVWALCL